jgi:lipocalin
MNQQRAKELLYRGKAVYANLNNGQRYRIIAIDHEYCHSISGLEINLANILEFN